MKKQIFKLTSILLAMVMMFTMFSMIPISAEDTANLSTAVTNLKNAWENLDYAKTTEECGVNYAAGWLGGTVDEKTVTFAADTAQLLMWGTQTSSSGMETFKMFQEKVSNIEDIYFYYSSNGDVTTQVNSILNNGKDAYAIRNFGETSKIVLENTNGVMTKVYLSDYLAKINATSTIYSTFVKDYVGTRDYFLRFGFNCTAAEGTQLTLGKIYAEADQNLLDTDSLTDDQWFDKAAALNLETLKADYDTTDETNWQAFETAYNAVLACSAEAAELRLRAAAEEMIVSESSYAYPVGIGRTPKAYVLNDKATDIYGDYYLTETIVGNATLNTAATAGIWLTNNAPASETAANRVNDANLRFGDYGENPYFVIKVNSITGANSANIGFWGRYNGTPIGSSNKDYASNYKVNVVAGGEYKVYIDDILSNMNTGNDTYNANFADWKNISTQALSGVSGASFNASIFSVMTQDAGVSVNMTVGSIVDAPNYEITSEKTGDEFVAEMAALDVARFGNTDAFEKALEIAIDEFPEAAKLVAVEKLRAAAAKMSTYGETILHPAKYWVSKRELSTMTTSTDPSYGEYTATYTVPNVVTMTKDTVTGQWLTTPGDIKTSGDENAMLNVNGAGDAYITIKVDSIIGADTTNLRFRYRANSTGINELLPFTLPVEVGGEYTFSLSQLFAGLTRFTDWKTFFKTTNFNFLVIAAEGAEAKITVGSAVFKNFYAPSSATGAQFVAEMKALKNSDAYASYSNTAEFEEALTVALAAFPEIGEAEAKQAALENLRTEWVKMIESTPVINTSYTHDRFWNASKTAAGCSTVDAGKYGKAFTATGITSTATEYGGVDGNTAENLLLIHNSDKTQTFGNSTDFGFWYKSTGDINIRTYLMFNTASYADSAVTTVLNGDGQWHFYSIRTLMGETKWAAMANRSSQNLYRFYIDLGNVVDAEVTSVDVTFGGVGFCSADTTVSGIDTANLVAEAMKVNTADYLDATAFEAALTAALEFYPELQAEVAKNKALQELRAAASEMYAYGDSFFLPAKHYYDGSRHINELTTPDDAKFGKYQTTVSLTGQSAAGAIGLWFTEPNSVANATGEATVYIGGDYEDATFTVKVNSVSAEGTYLAFYVRGNTTNYNVASTYKVPIVANGEYEISISDIFASTALANWKESSTSDYDGTKYTLTFISMAPVGGDADVTVGSIQYKSTVSISDATGIEFLKEMYCIDADAYSNNENFKAKLAAAVALYGEDELVTAKTAQNVINASANLNKVVALKPTTITTPWKSDEDEGGVEQKIVLGTSNNGDQFVTIDNGELANHSCAPDSASVIYEAKEGLRLADIDDISFSYKIENKKGDLTVARIWFYDKDFTKYEITTNEDTGEEEFVLDEEGNKVVARNEWQCGMEAYGNTRYLKVDANTDGWVETSLATIFGSDWKTRYIGFLNGTHTEREEYTEENTYIEKLAFGFNGANVEGDDADVSLGSMYVKYTENDYTITASYLDEAAVLADARAIDLTGVNKTVANEFKTLVKALETALDAEAANGNFVAGNYGAAVSIADLSVLAQHVDGTLGDDFIDLDCADVTDDGKVDEADVTALRVALLNQ